MARVVWWSLVAAFAALASAVLLARQGVIRLPPAYDPWAPLDIAAAPTLLTRFKLARLEGEPARCHAVLAETPLRFTPLPDRVLGEGCRLRDAVRITRSDVAFNGAFPVTCPLAAAWMLFEAHALQPAAERHFGQRVAEVSHLGSYACRDIGGRAGRRSEHATANAVDVAGFTLADGTRIALPRDWAPETGAKAAFLRDVRDGACRFFNAVLGPDYNAAHRDHLHLDRGRFRLCR